MWWHEVCSEVIPPLALWTRQVTVCKSNANQCGSAKPKPYPKVHPDPTATPPSSRANRLHPPSPPPPPSRPLFSPPTIPSLPHISCPLLYFPPTPPAPPPPPRPLPLPHLSSPLPPPHHQAAALSSLPLAHISHPLISPPTSMHPCSSSRSSPAPPSTHPPPPLHPLLPPQYPLRPSIYYKENSSFPPPLPTHPTPPPFSPPPHAPISLTALSPWARPTLPPSL